jgi:hypothetical protein
MEPKHNRKWFPDLGAETSELPSVSRTRPGNEPSIGKESVELGSHAENITYVPRPCKRRCIKKRRKGDEDPTFRGTTLLGSVIYMSQSKKTLGMPCNELMLDLVNTAIRDLTRRRANVGYVDILRGGFALFVEADADTQLAALARGYAMFQGYVPSAASSVPARVQHEADQLVSEVSEQARKQKARRKERG